MRDQRALKRERHRAPDAVVRPVEVASAAMDDATDLGSLARDADVRLYAAKRAGRDRAVAA